MRLCSGGRLRPYAKVLLSLGLLGIVLGLVALWVWTDASIPSSNPPLPTSEPLPTSWPRDARIDSPEYGINVHMWWDPWAAVRRDWALIKDAGFTWMKQRLAWHDVEGAEPGHYDWTAADRIVEQSEDAGVALVFRIDMPPAWAVPDPENEAHAAYASLPVVPSLLGDFCRTVAARYRGRVRGYQVWNEPNLAREWRGQPPDPEDYVKVLKACYLGIKTGDPEALVISAGLAPTGSSLPVAIPDADYLIGMYEAGATSYFDLLGLNAPGYKAPPEIAPEVVADPQNGYGGHRSFCFRHVEDMREIMVEYGDADKQVAVMEFGWHTDTSEARPEYSWFAVTPEQQAEYLVRAFEYARDHWSPWIGPMFVWNLPDPSWTPDKEEFWWGIVDPFWWGEKGPQESWPGGDLRPAYEALFEMEKP